MQKEDELISYLGLLFYRVNQIILDPDNEVYQGQINYLLGAIRAHKNFLDEARSIVPEDSLLLLELGSCEPLLFGIEEYFILQRLVEYYGTFPEDEVLYPNRDKLKDLLSRASNDGEFSLVYDELVDYRSYYEGLSTEATALYIDVELHSANDRFFLVFREDITRWLELTSF